MTNKTTKSALFTSSISLLLCFAMLLGTTFAWFTDNATSTNNRIIAGNLKVDLVMDKTENDNYVSIKNGTGDIFSETGNGVNWEPGKTEIVYLGVRNLGSLALKYNIVLNIKDNGLAGALEYAIIDGAKAADLSAATKWTDITNVNGVQRGDIANGTFTAAENGVLDEIINGVDEETDYFALAVHMKEEAGNDYQDKDIVIDVLVTATQKDAEDDSFGTDYDKNLLPPQKADSNDVIITLDDGVQTYYDSETGAYTLYDTADYAGGSIYAVPEGIEALGNYSFYYNNDVKDVTLASTVRSLGQAFNLSKVENVILNEGLEQIDSRAFKETLNLQEVKISSTVKTIADNAFQKSGIKTITIPATVETIGETAFGSSKIEKVIIEGNTSIQGYAFRSCANLREVYLNGDDVTFIPSTLNGRNAMWFCNGESNNPNTSNITFYVVNETVAQRVKTAMGAEAANIPVYVNGVLFQG